MARRLGRVPLFAARKRPEGSRGGGPAPHRVAPKAKDSHAVRPAQQRRQSRRRQRRGQSQKRRRRRKTALPSGQPSNGANREDASVEDKARSAAEGERQPSEETVGANARRNDEDRRQLPRRKTALRGNRRCECAEKRRRPTATPEAKGSQSTEQTVRMREETTKTDGKSRGERQPIDRAGSAKAREKTKNRRQNPRRNTAPRPRNQSARRKDRPLGRGEITTATDCGQGESRGP
jgi:hypothetical protein